jgi:hypothetical protein
MNGVISLVGVSLLGASALSHSIHIPEKWWRTNTILETQYKTLETEVIVDESYSIPEYTITDEGLLSLSVNKGTYQVEYAIQEVTTKEQQHFGPFRRTVDVVQEEYQKEEKSRTITAIVPATEIPLQITSMYFLNAETESDTTIIKTNNEGYAQMKLVPNDHDFVFSLDYFLTETELAEEIRALGWSDQYFVDLLPGFVRPVTYSVTVETLASLGMNTKRDIPISGYTLSGITAEEVLGFYP